MKTNYSFVRTPEELEKLAKIEHDTLGFFAQEKLQVYWEIDEDVYRKLLPPHFKPVVPWAFAYVANFGRPKCLYPYSEGALFILAEVEGVVGAYCLAMPLDNNDQAMDGGREFYGYPKKQAFVKLERRGNQVYGWIERNDVRYFEISATVGEELNDPEYGPVALGPEGPSDGDGNVLLVKYDLDLSRIEDKHVGVSSLAAFHNFRIQTHINRTVTHSKEYARVDEMIIRPSEDDPWCELAPKKILGAEYSVFDTYMNAATTLYEYKAEEYPDVLPHVFTLWDSWMYGRYHASYRATNFYTR
jgi:acetoacetate decarboxylase